MHACSCDNVFRLEHYGSAPCGAGREGQGTYVLLFTTLNTVGRMVGGVFPEKLLHQYGTPRCCFLPSMSNPCINSPFTSPDSGLSVHLDVWRP